MGGLAAAYSPWQQGLHHNEYRRVRDPSTGEDYVALARTELVKSVLVLLEAPVLMQLPGVPLVLVFVFIAFLLQLYISFCQDHFP